MMNKFIFLTKVIFSFSFASQLPHEVEVNGREKKDEGCIRIEEREHKLAGILRVHEQIPVSQEAL